MEQAEYIPINTYQQLEVVKQALQDTWNYQLEPLTSPTTSRLIYNTLREIEGLQAKCSETN